MEKKNLEEELGELLRKAGQWNSQENSQLAATDDSTAERDACLAALANVITNYVTGQISSRRPVIPSEPTPPSRPKRISTGLVAPSSSEMRSTKRTPSTGPPTPRRSSGYASRTSLGEYYLKKGGPQYHSENRLDRFSPAPRLNETPLENKASRLRRMSIERRKSEKK